MHLIRDPKGQTDGKDYYPPMMGNLNHSFSDLPQGAGGVSFTEPWSTGIPTWAHGSTPLFIHV